LEQRLSCCPRRRQKEFELRNVGGAEHSNNALFFHYRQMVHRIAREEAQGFFERLTRRYRQHWRHHDSIYRIACMHGSTSTGPTVWSAPKAKRLTGFPQIVNYARSRLY